MDLQKKEGVPVLANVAAIFAPICPDFPTPVMINFPVQLYIKSTTSSKVASMLCVKSNIA